MTAPTLTETITNPFTVAIDTREQHPYSFTKLRSDARQKHRPLSIPTLPSTLKSGDYSIIGHESQIAVERKSLEDLYSTLGQGRERFERELQRLQEMQFSAIVIEAGWNRILSKPCEYCDGNGEFTSTCVRCNGHGLFDETECNGCSGVGFLLVGTCSVCEGSGQVHPVDHSRLNPKTVYRTILAWQQRYPHVHWWPAESRRFAERTTFRILERFWIDQNK